jgi:hypothetical protein
MRVPDQVKNCALFVGLAEMPEPEYRGTAFIVTVPGTQSNHFAFLVTAGHVAKHLQGKEFYIRVNRRDGTAVAMKGRPSDPWWFHPTEKDYVDAAITLFSPLDLAQLDVAHIPIGMFATSDTIRTNHLGIGDEVFITGLFTKVTETTKNIPIVRTGTLAMIPGEKIPFGESMIDAYLVEARSIGGLSGSPVFIRETITIPVPDGPPGSVAASLGAHKYMHGIGRIHFLGSMIGHWDVPEGFSPTQSEAVNMGIAPVVPAHKIKEIIFQPELETMMKRVNDEMRAKNQKGATLDFAPSKKQTTEAGFDIPVPSSGQFLDGLKKASRKVEPSKS